MGSWVASPVSRHPCAHLWPRGPATAWHTWATGIFVKTENPVSELSQLSTSLALLPRSRTPSSLLRNPQTSFSYSLLSSGLFGLRKCYPKRYFLFFFFFLSKSPWPLHHLNKHSKFHYELRLLKSPKVYILHSKVYILHSEVCFYFSPWHTSLLRW